MRFYHSPTLSSPSPSPDPSLAPFSVQGMLEAQKRIENSVIRTPILKPWRGSRLEQLASGGRSGSKHLGRPAMELIFKCENLQTLGAFKIRGVTNALECMSQEALERGVVAFSTGNHAIAIAHATRIISEKRGIKISTSVIMPKTASTAKVAAVQSANPSASVVLHGSSMPEAMCYAYSLGDTTGATVIPPADHLGIVAGQGTVALELLDQLDEAGEPPLDALLIPSSGGALLAGSAVVAGALSPHTLIVGCEPARGGADLRLSRQTQVRSDRIDTSVMTVADGLRSNIAPCVWPILRSDEMVHQVYGAEEDDIRKAVQLLLEDMKMVVEPCSAVPLAVAFFNPDFRKIVSEAYNIHGISEQGNDGEIPLRKRDRRFRVGIILTGGNADIKLLAQMG
ncbi:tryptophan synthase beta subunit-like PLP-dependent enzyme [Trichoderma velutinum]